VGIGGSVTLAATSTATPLAPTPTYTIVPGRNYVVIATDSSATKTEVWTAAFAGHVPASNVFLGTSANETDQYATLAALYMYALSPAPISSASPTFDDWNFNAVNAWVTSLRNGNLNIAEQTALTDIASAQNSGTTLYPGAPRWNSAQPTNPTIKTDLTAIFNSADAAKPTPCPTSAVDGSAECTGTPTP
jgi:hypothetical protein